VYHSCAWFDVRVTLWECEVTGAGLLVGSTEGGSDRIIIPMCTRAFSLFLYFTLLAPPGRRNFLLSFLLTLTLSLV